MSGGRLGNVDVNEDVSVDADVEVDVDVWMCGCMDVLDGMGW